MNNLTLPKSKNTKFGCIELVTCNGYQPLQMRCLRFGLYHGIIIKEELPCVMQD